jgi:hypothetical protein
MSSRYAMGHIEPTI